MAMSYADRCRWEQEALANPRLTATQKNVLARLALHLNIKTGRCDPSVETLAKGAGVAERTVQTALSRAEALGIIERAIGGGRARTTSYALVAPSKTVHGNAPFSETVHRAAPFQLETVHPTAEKGAPDIEKPCTAAHPNIENKRNNDYDVRLQQDFGQWYLIYPRKKSYRAALKAYKQARSRATAGALLDGAKRYAAQRAGHDPQFTKYPATWLNGDCWLDEPEIQSADVTATPSSNAEVLSIPERMAAAAKRARDQ
jgi:DNA-binding transcriptional regulator YhcF (GntR family)